MMTLHLIVYRTFFTKLCMSKVQYVCAEHVTSYKCVTSFGRKAAILFSGYAINAKGTAVFDKLCVWNGL